MVFTVDMCFLVINHLKQVCVAVAAVVMVVVIEREAAEKTATLSVKKTEGARSSSAKRMSGL